MFFVNPKYDPPILTKPEKAKRLLQIQSLLMIPKDGRSPQTKRQIYQFFIDNPKLIEIQTYKSLTARILAVGEIQLITEEDYVKLTFPPSSQTNRKTPNTTQNPSPFIILNKFLHDSTLAVIRTQAKDSIMLQNQEPIKKIMLQLKQFSFLKQFEYHESLYLAHFVQKHKMPTYKEYLFTENDPADFVYFIQEGEFQVFKNAPELTLNKEKSLKKMKRPRETSPLNKFLQNQESPYKMKKVKLNKEELSKIQGGSGQCFGETEIFLQTQNRQFSFRCNSLSSKIFKIHFKHFQQILALKTVRFNRLKREYKQKYEDNMEKLKLHKKIKDRMGSPEPKMTEQEQQTNSLNKKVSSILFEMDNFKTLDNEAMEGAFTLPNNSLTIPVSELNAKRNIYRGKKLYSENGKKLSVKQGVRYGSQLKSETNSSVGEYSKSIDGKGTSLDRPFFPLINHKKFSKASDGQNKGTNGTLCSRRKNKVKGLIDISVVIEEKQQLHNSLTGNLNPEFSFYKLDQKNAKRLNHQKFQLLKVQPQQKMPTHSKHYLKKFVQNSLKKSKYYQELYQGRNHRSIQIQRLWGSKTHQIMDTTSFSIQSEGEVVLSHRYGGMQVPMYSLSKEIRDSLVSNEFDKFFDKI